VSPSQPPPPQSYFEAGERSLLDIDRLCTEAYDVFMDARLLNSLPAAHTTEIYCSHATSSTITRTTCREVLSGEVAHFLEA
jgi:hypothetical protein